MDEQLCHTSGGGLLGCLPSSNGSLWCPYVEKAVAAYCGGWDEIVHFTTIHAWALLTGSRAQFMFKSETTDSNSLSFKSYGLLDMSKKTWKKMAKSPKECKTKLSRTPWPEVSNEGRCILSVEKGAGNATRKEMFMHMIAWKQRNYLLMGCTDGTSSGGITKSMTILEFYPNAADTGFDMVKVRNLVGKGNLDGLQWGADSAMWAQYPGLEEELGSVSADPHARTVRVVHLD